MRPEQWASLSEGLVLLGYFLMWMAFVMFVLWVRATYREYRRRQWLQRFTLQMKEARRRAEDAVCSQEEAKQMAEELWNRATRVAAAEDQVRKERRRPSAQVLDFPGCRRRPGQNQWRYTDK